VVVRDPALSPSQINSKLGSVGANLKSSDGFAPEDVPLDALSARAGPNAPRPFRQPEWRWFEISNARFEIICYINDRVIFSINAQLGDCVKKREKTGALDMKPTLLAARVGAFSTVGLLLLTPDCQTG
jgi:hypothetical protein